MRKSLALALVLAACAALPAPAQSPAKRASVEAALALKPGVRLDQLVAMFGEGYEFRPNTYDFFAGNGASLWVSVSPADRGRVERILVFNPKHAGDAWPQPTVVFNLIEKTKHRQCNQIKLHKHRASLSQIIEAWGPPDWSFGSGIARDAWYLEDGGMGLVTLIYGEGDLFPFSCG